MTRSARRCDETSLTVAAAAAALRQGATTAVRLTRAAIALAESEAAGAVFIHLRKERALLEAEGWDTLRRAGDVPSELAGIPVSLKDLFDVAGEVTAAGCAALAARAPATEDAAVVRRLRRAGAVLLGRTNMTELAFSGLGLNPHFGTPRNPSDRRLSRIPGGSSAGAAVSVALGIVPAAIGTDTGGSVRIPASLCGLVGFKPTARRVPLEGTVALSPSLDSIGPIARTVACCALVDDILAGGNTEVELESTPHTLRIAIPRDLVWDDLDPQTSAALEAALDRLSRSGATLVDVVLPEFWDIVAVNAAGGLPAIECFSAHRELLERSGERLDPRVRVRIERGRQISAAEHRELIEARDALQRDFARRMAGFDLWLMPTVPRVAPLLESLATDAAYFEANRLMLRNPGLVNFLDGCAVTLPCHAPGTLPVGVSLAAGTGMDHQLLAIAARLAAVVASM